MMIPEFPPMLYFRLISILRRVSYLLVSISETTEFLLTSSVPNVELDWSVVGMEHHWVDFDSECSNVLLLELSSQMTLDEGGLVEC